MRVPIAADSLPDLDLIPESSTIAPPSFRLIAPPTRPNVRLPCMNYNWY